MIHLSKIQRFKTQWGPSYSRTDSRPTDRKQNISLYCLWIISSCILTPFPLRKRSVAKIALTFTSSRTEKPGVMTLRCLLNWSCQMYVCVCVCLSRPHISISWIVYCHMTDVMSHPGLSVALPSTGGKWYCSMCLIGFTLKDTCDLFCQSVIIRVHYNSRLFSCNVTFTRSYWREERLEAIHKREKSLV